MKKRLALIVLLVCFFITKIPISIKQGKDLTKLIIFNMNTIILMFGFGMVVHLIVSVVEQKIFISKLNFNDTKIWVFINIIFKKSKLLIFHKGNFIVI